MKANRLKCLVLRGGELTKLEILYEQYLLISVYEDVDREPEPGLHSMTDIIEEYGETYYEDESHYRQVINSNTITPCYFRHWYSKNIGDFEVLNRPYTKSKIKELIDYDNLITGIIRYDLDDIISGDIESLNSGITKLLVEEGTLSDISWIIVGHEDINVLLLDVIGCYKSEDENSKFQDSPHPNTWAE